MNGNVVKHRRPLLRFSRAVGPGEGCNPKNSGETRENILSSFPQFQTHSLAKQNQISSYFDVPTTPADIQLHANPGKPFAGQ